LERLREATLGEYDILGEVARGGMASVYLAHDIALARKVAIKVMSPGLVLGEGMVERFKREARTSASLSHPNIIPVYTVREVNGLCFFVMKLIQGTTLDAALRELQPVPIAMVEAVLAQAGSALGYAHRNGVIHRDVKPGNILIDDEGWIVVTDFGIAKVADAEGLTLTGMAVGTPAYMSPEQCLGAAVTPASDQYALGVIAYEMLSGQRPFGGASSLALMYAHANTPPPALESLRPDCPPPLRAAVMRMLEKEPAARWPSMEAAIKAIGGGTPPNPDEATRTRLGELARSGGITKLVARAQTPRSPVPVTRARPHHPELVPAAAKRSWALPIVGLVAVAGIATSVALLLDRSRGDSPPVGSAVSVAQSDSSPAVDTRSAVQAAPPPTVPASRQAGPPETTRVPLGAGGETRIAGPAARVAAAGATPSPAPVPAPPPAAPPETVAATPPVAVRDSLAAPRAAAPAPLAAAPAAAPTAADPRAEIETVVRLYGTALESGDIGRVQRAYPGMTRSQRDGLVAFYAAGGKLETRWAVEDVVLEQGGSVARARIVGTNRVTASRARPVEEPVSLQVRLERQAAGWRLMQVAN
jgi:hypothetical protein